MNQIAKHRYVNLFSESDFVSDLFLYPQTATETNLNREPQSDDTSPKSQARFSTAVVPQGNQKISSTPPNGIYKDL